jgi:hypothetical protein
MKCSSCGLPLTAPAAIAARVRDSSAAPPNGYEMLRAFLSVLLSVFLAGCAATSAVSAVVETGATVAKTGVKAGGAVADGAINAVDEDEQPEEQDD